MLKRFTFIILTLLGFVSLSCTREELDPCQGDMQGMTMLCLAEDAIDGVNTKSSIASNAKAVALENKINDVTLYQFEDGVLRYSYYAKAVDGAVPLKITGDPGKTYSVYALANVGDWRDMLSKGDSYSKLASLVNSFAKEKMLGDIAKYGIPMVCAGNWSGSSYAGESLSFVPGQTYSLYFKRLMARYAFSINTTGLKYGTFKVESLVLKQSPLTVMPFVNGSKATNPSKVCDGDHTSAEDLRKLEASGNVFFYVLENCQGTLLPNNTDPWKKVPENFDNSNLCTYIELKGKYTDLSGKLTATHIYRMYLGMDNTKNFDIRRNTRNSLKLTLNDDGFLRGSWKVERHVLSDSRQLSFDQSSYIVEHGKPCPVTVNASNEKGLKYMLSPKLVEAGVRYDELSYTLVQTKQLPEDMQGFLNVATWDFNGPTGMVATANVTAKKYVKKPDVTIETPTPTITLAPRQSITAYFVVMNAKNVNFDKEHSPELTCIPIPSGNGLIRVKVGSAIPGTYTLKYYYKEDPSIYATVEIRVVESTAEVQPIGIENVTVKANLYDVGVDGPLQHDPDCPYNHFWPIGDDDWMDIKECPNWRPVQVSGGKAGTVEITFNVVSDYKIAYEKGKPYLTYRKLTPGVDFDIDYFTIISKTGAEGETTQYKDVSYSGDQVTISGQFQDPSLEYFKVVYTAHSTSYDSQYRTAVIDFDGKVLPLCHHRVPAQGLETVSYSFERFEDETNMLRGKWHKIQHNSSQPVFLLTGHPLQTNVNSLATGQEFMVSYDETYDYSEIYALNINGVVLRNDEYSRSKFDIEVIENEIVGPNKYNECSAHLALAIYTGFKECRHNIDFQTVESSWDKNFSEYESSQGNQITVSSGTVLRADTKEVDKYIFRGGKYWRLTRFWCPTLPANYQGKTLSIYEDNSWRLK